MVCVYLTKIIVPLTKCSPQFVDMFGEAKQAARELVKERQLASQRLQDQDKPLPPAGTSPSPTSPPAKSPSVISPPVSASGSTSKSPSPSSLTSPGPYTTTTTTTATASSAGGVASSDGTSSGGSDGEKEKKEAPPVVNGSQNLQLEPLKISSNGHTTAGSGTGSSGEVSSN